MRNNLEYTQIWQELMLPIYNPPSVSFIRGNGMEIFDSENNRYLDFLSGIATNVLGHAHPRIVAAVSEQVAKLGHVSNLYGHPQALTLAEKLKAMTGDPSAKIFFCNSGAEANEAAIKLSRLSNRQNIVSAIGSFHGRTMGALSLTGQKSKQEPFQPLLPGISHVRFGDADALKKEVTRETAMVILEPIMGEAGVITPPSNYLADAREICDRSGSLLVIDAVQTGMGRTGNWFGYESSDIQPDAITVAKGLGGGLPIGALIALGKTTELFTAGSHGSTFGGNPIASAAGNATIDEIVDKGYLESNLQFGSMITSNLSSISAIKEVRGKGLLIGIEFKDPIAKKIATILLTNGFLVNAVSDETIRIAPPYIITSEQVLEFASALQKAVETNG